MNSGNIGSMTNVLPILLRRKGTLLMWGVLTAALAFTVSRVIPLHYSSEGSLIVETRPTTPEIAGQQTILTEVDVIRSPGLIRHSVRDFHLVDAPDLIPSIRLPEPIDDFLTATKDYVVQTWRSISNSKADDIDREDKIVIYISKNIHVDAREKSSVISVQFEAGSPDTATKVVNAVMSTYLAHVLAARDQGNKSTEEWIAQREIGYRQAVATAETSVSQFMQTHNMSEVQGSQTAAIQLSKEQDQLVMARDTLARKEAALATIKSGNVTGSEEVMESKTIQNYKQQETLAIAEIAAMSTTDPRRAQLQTKVNGIRSLIQSEISLVIPSLTRNVQIARANVAALEESVRKQSGTAHDSSMASSTLRQLTNDLESKRQLLVAFMTKAGEMRVAAQSAPIAHSLFEAVPPPRPVFTFGAISLLLGFIGGTLASAGCMIFRSTMHLRINTADEMQMVTGMPVSGTLPDIKHRSGNIMIAPQTVAPITETFRAMWLTMRPQLNKGSVIVVTSSETKEGKTTVAGGLAHRFADDGYNVLLIDGDLRRPSLSAAFRPSVRDLPPKSVESVVDNQMALDKAILPIKVNLDCLITSGRVQNPVKFLSSDRFAQLVADAQTRYDFVIIDSPPVLHVVDSIVLSKLAQYIVFVVQAGRLTNEMVTEAMHRFPDDQRGKIHTLLTRVRRTDAYLQGYYSGYVPGNKG